MLLFGKPNETVMFTPITGFLGMTMPGMAYGLGGMLTELADIRASVYTHVTYENVRRIF